LARIVHIAIEVDDLEKATEFYEKGFGFVEVETAQVRDHTARHLKIRLFRVYCEGIFTTETQSSQRGLFKMVSLNTNFSATSAPPRCNLRVLLHYELE